MSEPWNLEILKTLNYSNLETPKIRNLEKCIQEKKGTSKSWNIGSQKPQNLNLETLKPWYQAILKPLKPWDLGNFILRFEITLKPWFLETSKSEP
jgi:hypothetical protein